MKHNSVFKICISLLLASCLIRDANADADIGNFTISYNGDSNIINSYIDLKSTLADIRNGDLTLLGGIKELITNRIDDISIIRAFTTFIEDSFSFDLSDIIDDFRDGLFDFDDWEIVDMLTNFANYIVDFRDLNIIERIQAGFSSIVGFVDDLFDYDPNGEGASNSAEEAYERFRTAAENLLDIDLDDFDTITDFRNTFQVIRDDVETLWENAIDGLSLDEIRDAFDQILEDILDEYSDSTENLIVRLIVIGLAISSGVSVIGVGGAALVALSIGVMILLI